MRGRWTRCPNPVCREVFQVPNEEAPPASAMFEQLPDAPSPDSESIKLAPIPEERESGTPASQVSGSVGDIIPMLQAEQAEQVPMAPPASASVQEMIPLLSAEPVDYFENDVPRRQPPKPAARTAPEAEPAAPNWQNQPPPVRRSSPAAPPSSSPPPPAVETPRPSKKKPASIPKPKAPDAVPKAETSPPPAMPAQEPVLPPEPAPDTIMVPSDPSRETMLAPPGGPLELPPGAWEAPPVRRPTEEGAAETPVPDHAPPAEAHDPDLMPVAATKRHARWMIPGIFALVGLMTVVVVLFLKLARGETEEGRFLEAKKEYEEGRYSNGAEKFKKLVADYSDSPKLPTYRFFAEFSDVRAQIHNPKVESEQAYANLLTFLGANENEPLAKDLMKEYQPDIRQSFEELIEAFTRQADQSLEEPVLARAEQAVKVVGNYVDLPPGWRKKRQEEFTEVKKKIAKGQSWKSVAEELDRLIAKPSKEGPEQARRAIAEAAREYADFKTDPGLQARVDQIDDGALRIIRYVPAEGNGNLPRQEKSGPALIVAPWVQAPTGPLAVEDRVVFALARGVLYALSAKTGDVLWSTRVGIDSTTLPVRLPATETSQEIALVLSTDTYVMTARDVRTGRAFWEHQLGAPCLGRPLIVNRRAYVPTIEGEVHEIEIIGGKLLGYYELGRPLTVGGVRQEGTDLVYFPAESRTVFVLDVAKHSCEAVLHAGHPAGSLRGEPFIISRSEDRTSYPDFLILNQAEGLSATKLRPFQLPIKREGGKNPPQLEPRLTGWSWFPPYHDGEKLLMATDAGALGMFGIQQVHNYDPLLFSASIKEIELGGPIGQPGLGQVVYAAPENDFWFLSNGELSMRHWDTYREKMVKIWGLPGLGSPLHASQVDETSETLFLTTQSLSQQTCQITAVDANKGKVLWKRQLGLVCQGEPVVLGQEVVAIDQGGGWFRFEPGKIGPQQLDQEWLYGAEKTLGAPLESAEDLRAYLLPSADGKSVYEIVSALMPHKDAAKTPQLIIRRHEPGKNHAEIVVNLRSHLAGTPGLGPDGLVLPLANRNLARVALDGSPVVDGPTWRDERADAGAKGDVTVIGPGDFLSTDGSNGLIRWNWPAGGRVFHRETNDKLPTRIVTPPVILTPPGANSELQVLVADARGVVSLLQEDASKKVKPDDPRTWKAVRSWSLNGKITAGPFLRDRWFGCVVDHARLVWIDPTKDKAIAWEHPTAGEGIVSQPQLVHGLVVVADRSGRFVGLDPTTGKTRWKHGYALKGSVAPAVTPIAFGPDRAFAPLTDGTVLLLDLHQLRHPLQDFPTFR